MLQREAKIVEVSWAKREQLETGRGLTLAKRDQSVEFPVSSEMADTHFVELFNYHY